MKESLKCRICKLETRFKEILKEEQKPVVLKVHSISIGTTTTQKQENDHGPVDK